MLDALVVGAGPAGVAAGITAHAAGLRVLVIDKATFPRDKTCGDGLTAAALRWYERLGFDVRALPGFQPVHDVVVQSPSGRTIELPLPEDGLYAGIVTREELDAGFVAHARARGVDIRESCGIEALDGENVSLTDGSTVTARWIVAADGHWSRTRRLVDPDRGVDLGTWHAERWYVDGYDDDRIQVAFEPSLLPGYLWVFPLPDGRANVGWGVLREGVDGKELDRLSHVVADRLEQLIPGVTSGPRRAWPIPTAYARDQLVVDNVLFTGDAAAVVDAMTGEGIAQALETGVLAAEAIAVGGDVGARYRRSVERALGHDLRFAAALSRILRSRSGARGAVRIAGISDWTRRNFARWLLEDYPRAILLTPSRWRRKMLTGTGAYTPNTPSARQKRPSQG